MGGASDLLGSGCKNCWVIATIQWWGCDKMAKWDITTAEGGKQAGYYIWKIYNFMFHFKPRARVEETIMSLIFTLLFYDEWILKLLCDSEYTLWRLMSHLHLIKMQLVIINSSEVWHKYMFFYLVYFWVKFHKTSLLRRLQAQTLLYATPPLHKIPRSPKSP